MNQIVNTACWNSSTFTNNSSTILINCTGNMSLQMQVWSNVFILLITQKHSLSLIKWNTVHGKIRPGFIFAQFALLVSE